MTDAFNVDTASAVSLPLLQSYHQARRQVVALSPHMGSAVGWYLPG